MNAKKPSDIRARASGFSLIELLITVVVFSIVAISIGIVLYGASHSKSTTSSLLEASQGARVALDMMSRDVRSAGYGADLTYPGGPQPSIAYVDSQEIILSENLYPYPDTVHSQPTAPLAYDPTGSPKPHPLTVSGYVPPGRYNTGAELVRYTLDLNNDGLVNENDLATPAGADAQATPDPNDYLLVRQIYGDSTDNIRHNNGGVQEHIALVHKPGDGVPPLFTVYMRDTHAEWDWSNGPVPAAQLADVERVEIRVTASSGKPDGQDRFQTAVLQQQVNSLRNTPDAGARTYTLDGYVYDDQDRDHERDAAEPGLANVAVRASGTYISYTSPTGYFQMRVPAGAYTLRHTPPTGYGPFNSPDSFLVAVPPASAHSFGDTARAGGWVSVHVWIDEDGNGSEDASERPASAVAVSTVPGSGATYTDADGNALMFVSPGDYTVGVTLPDSMVSSTPNPIGGTMTNGGSATAHFGLQPSLTGTVEGTVFRDNNRNGTLDAGEPGLASVWVGVTKDGIAIAGWDNTDASGNYSIRVPVNDPPHTQSYYVYTVPPVGFFPTSTTAISALWVQNNATITNRNFGMAAYQIIVLNASRVLSLEAGDMIEKDWNGNQTQNARRDCDIILGADAYGADNISVWFNNYNSTPLFSANPDYTRLAPQSVMALALDTLDTGSPVTRLDVVTGTRRAPNGNFFVWLNQNSSGNLGYLPTALSSTLSYTTLDGGDVQAVVTMDVANDNMPDLIVGTRSPTGGRGTFEVWKNSGGTAPTFTRDEVYPNAGSIPGNSLGEVTAMALADFDNDGNRDLVVGTRTGTYSGELLFFRFVSKTPGGRFVCRARYILTDDAVTSLAVCDPDNDGWRDVIVGTQSAANRGRLQQWRNNGSVTLWSFSDIHNVDASGIVMSLRAADLGGGSGADIVVGWRQNDTSYGGGVEVYYMDLGILPPVGVDVSGGAVTNMVPAVTTANFNWGVNPAATAPYLTDIAAGVKVGPTTGELVVFIR